MAEEVQDIAGESLFPGEQTTDLSVLDGMLNDIPDGDDGLSGSKESEEGETQVPAPVPVPDNSYINSLLENTNTTNQNFAKALELLNKRSPSDDNDQELPEFAVTGAEISDEDMQAYGESAPFIRKMMADTINPVLKQQAEYFRNQLTERDSVIEQLRGNVGQVTRSSYDNAIMSAEPDWMKKVNSQEWKTLMAQPAPYSNGQTVGDMVKIASEAGNPVPFIEALKQIKPEGTQPSRTPSSSSTTSSSQPAGSASPGKKQTPLKMSMYLEFKEAVDSGRYSYEDPKVRKLFDMFDEAAMNGTLIRDDF